MQHQGKHQASQLSKGRYVSQTTSHPSEIPAEIVRAWEAVGATYGIVQLDENRNLDQSYLVPISDPTMAGLRGFSFENVSSRIMRGQFAALPVPPVPFGLVLKSTSENNMDDELDLDAGAMSRPSWLQELSRFGSTLTELELWGSEFPAERLSYLRPLSNLRTLGICSTGIRCDSAIQYLIDLPALETVRIAQGNLSEVEGKKFAAISCLRNLYLEGFRATAEGVALLGSARNLQSLRLQMGEREVDSAVVKQVARLTSVRCLRWGNSGLSDSDLFKLSALPNLERLEIFNTRVTDAGAESLKNCNGLCHLDLSGTSITDKALSVIAGLPRLTYLDVSRTKIGDDGAEKISAMSSLQVLHANNTEMTDAGSEFLGRCTGLRTLFLVECAVSDEGIAALISLQNLQALGLYGTGITDDGLQHLKSLRQLRRVDLRRTGVTDEGLAKLAGMATLEALDIDVTVMTDVGLRNWLRVVRTPETLHLQRTKVTDEGLECLADCSQLVNLNLESTAVTDAGIPSLQRLEKLQSLNLCHTAISDVAIEHLLGLRDLRLLNFSNLRGGQMSVDGLKRLSELPKLRRLVLYSWEITEEEIQELKAHFPDCEILN